MDHFRTYKQPSGTSDGPFGLSKAGSPHNVDEVLRPLPSVEDWTPSRLRAYRPWKKGPCVRPCATKGCLEVPKSFQMKWKKGCLTENLLKIEQGRRKSYFSSPRKGWNVTPNHQYTTYWYSERTTYSQVCCSGSGHDRSIEEKRLLTYYAPSNIVIEVSTYGQNWGELVFLLEVVREAGVFRLAPQVSS